MKKFTQFWSTHRPHARAEDALKRWGALFVALFAGVYYAQYYRSGLPLAGEGGTVAVVATRLMEGQRPIVDTFLGYNLMWFFPVAWLFELTGPNYVALRIYFFAICTMTGVLAFLVVRRVTGSGWFATLAALGPVLIPGMLFRNYMAFLAMLNMLTLLQAYVFPQRTPLRQWLWIAAAGLALGLTFLIRIDVAAFFSVITLGLLVLFPLGFRGDFLRRARTAAGALALTVVLFFATHAPFYLDGKKRGYADAFVAQYTGWINLVVYLAKVELAKKSEPPPQIAEPGPSATPSAAAASNEPVAPNEPAVPNEPAAPNESAASNEPEAAPKEGGNSDIGSSDYLQKQGLAEFLEKKTFYERAFVLITYLPVPTAILIIFPAGFLLVVALLRENIGLRTEALAVLIATGSALTLFPQFFFFRPDTPHLSEFMAPFWIATACAMWTAFSWARKNRVAAVWCAVVMVFCLADLGLYFYHSFPRESAGTIAARRKRKYEFAAENGVRVKLKKLEHEELQSLCDVIKTRTKPGDYVVCYPYAPTINFMTDRPSYEGNLYVDNAYNVSTFHQETMKEFEKFHPAAVLIDNRAMNQTESSRFKNWAAETYRWIRENYRYAGTFRRQEIYLRPDLAGADGGNGRSE